VPVTRDEAIELEQQFLAAVPAGSLLAAQQQHLLSWAKQQRQHWQQQFAACPGMLQAYQQQMLTAGSQKEQPPPPSVSPHIIHMQEVMDRLLHAAAKQVCHADEQVR